MAIVPERIKALRERKGFTQDDLAERLGMNRANISNYERGIITNIPADVLQKMADLFDTTTDYLLGRTDDPSPFALTAKNERDIAKDLERIMSNLENKEAMAFYGDEMELDEEGRELLKASVEQAMRLAKRMAKEKFTPKKYRRDSDKG